MADAAVITEAVQVLMSHPAFPTPALVLGAGCGSTSDVYLPFKKKVAGIDIDAEQLKHNDKIEIKIQGDLQTYELPQNEFDLVACVDVLEHLPFPENALVNMSKSVKSGGYLLIDGPEPYSYKGFVAKYTPSSMTYFNHQPITDSAANVPLLCH